MLLLPPAAAQDRLPNVVSVEQRLTVEIRKMIETGHLRPLDENCTEHYWMFRHQFGDLPHHLWRNPAETIYTLLRALPHVPAEMKRPLRDYIQQEWRRNPPTRVTRMDWSGANRQYALAPPEVDEWCRTAGSTAPGAGFAAWKFNPFNYYACWMYAQAGLGNASGMLQELPPPQKYPADEFGAALPLKSLPHALNVHIAGYYGFLGLEDLAGRKRNPQVEQWLAEAQAKRVEFLADDPIPVAVHPIEAGGFKYLVPELGEYLHTHARDALTRNLKVYSAKVAPLWFIARADETTRMTRNHIGRGTKFAEGSTSHHYEYWATFQAMALALKEPRETLELYLDGPAAERGDLFYIQNLVSTIEAVGTKGPQLP